MVWTPILNVVSTSPAVTRQACSVNFAGIVTLAGLKSSEELKCGRYCHDEGLADFMSMLALPLQGVICGVPYAVSNLVDGNKTTL